MEMTAHTDHKWPVTLDTLVVVLSFTLISELVSRQGGLNLKGFLKVEYRK